MRFLLLAVLVSLLVSFAPGLTQVSAGAEHVLRIATLAPRGSPAFRTLDAWANTLKQKTGGQVRIQYFAGGISGDERDVIRKMKIGQLDGSGLTSVGLGQIYRPILVLQMPGLFETTAELHAVRRAMDAEWKLKFAEQGYVLLGWFDAGFGRVFSKRPIERPTDYRKVRAWMWREDPMFPAFMEVVGANGVPLGLAEVFPALQTGMVDTVVASAVAAVGLQWFRYVSYMSEEAGVAIVGASLLSKKSFEALPPDAQEVLRETSPAAHDRLNAETLVEDRRAHAALLSRGMKVFSIAPYRHEWEEATLKLRDKLVGRLFSREQLEQVWKLAQASRQPPAR
jgi:TRAP-type C4-dicarboxylate transport system substrate-binding protein